MRKNTRIHDPFKQRKSQVESHNLNEFDHMLTFAPARHREKKKYAMNTKVFTPWNSKQTKRCSILSNSISKNETQCDGHRTLAFNPSVCD